MKKRLLAFLTALAFLFCGLTAFADEPGDEEFSGYDDYEDEWDDDEYYDDEELDRFRGREGSEYTDEEAEEFRNVLYTMRSEEVAGWVRSLQLRQVNIPDDVKDEVFLIVGERRTS